MSKVNWGVLGTSGFAKNVSIPAMQKADNVNLYAIAGRSAEKAESYKAEFGFEKAYGSYEQLLADKNVSAVYLPLANHVHKEWVIKAAEAGKHILCEKPIAGNLAELNEMIACCKKNNVILMEAYAYLHSEITNHIKTSVKNGVIGDVVFMESSFFTPLPDVANYRVSKDCNGGSIYDLGCYPISLFINLMDKAPNKVSAMAHYNTYGIDDYANAFMEFDGGVNASIVCGMCSSSQDSRYFIYGTKGMIDAPIGFNDSGELSYFVVKGEKREEIKVNTTNNYVLEFLQMGRCILNNDAPFVSNEFSLSTTKTIEEILKSMGYIK